MTRHLSNRSTASQYIVALLAVCLLGSVLPQHDSPQVCFGRNPFLRYLRRHDVKVFETPQPSTSKTCVAEWTAHSTCCDGGSLVKYAENDIKQLDRDIKDVKNDVKKVKKYIKKYDEKIEEAIKDSKMKDKKDYLKKLNKDLKDFYGEVKSIFDKEKKADDEKDECFQRIIQIRTSSLCSICSGRATDFLFKGQIKISMADCRITIDKCGDTWRKSIDLVDAIVLAKKIRKQLKEVIPKDELMDFEDNEIDRLKEWIGSRHLRDPIKECDGKPKDCSESSAKLLCETFITIRKHGFLEDLGDMIEHHHPAKAAKQAKKEAQEKNAQNQPQATQPAQDQVIQNKKSAKDHTEPNKEQKKLQKLEKLKWKLGKSRLLQHSNNNDSTIIDRSKKNDTQVSDDNPVPMNQTLNCQNLDLMNPPPGCKPMEA